jgi:hypothetical protein
MATRTISHNNRDCREAVTLALLLAKQWQQDLFILFGYHVMRYVIHEAPSPNRHCQVGYVVSADGKVSPGQGFPSYAELFGGEALAIQFRLGRNHEWTILGSEAFRRHERHLAQNRVNELNFKGNGMEYRVWPA